VSYLLDTNVLSEARKQRGEQNVKDWLASVSSRELYLSVLILGEIRQGIERLRPRDRAQAQLYETWLVALSRDYADRILPITPEIADEWGRLNAPDPLPAVDGLLAATAKVMRLTLVTRNTRDLARTGVALLNPFAPLP